MNDPNSGKLGPNLYPEEIEPETATQPERREVSAEETARRERAQAPRLGYPGADQMMRWQRDYK